MDKAEGDTLRRYGAATIARYAFALDVLTPENSPHDYCYGCFNFANAIAAMIDLHLNPESALIDRAVDRLMVSGTISDRSNDWPFITRSLNLLAGFARLIYAQRTAQSRQSLHAMHRHIQTRAEQYTYSPFRVFFGMAEAQLAFMIGDLSEDLGAVDEAIRRAEILAASPPSEAGDPFLEMAKMGLEEMREMRSSLGK